MKEIYSTNFKIEENRLASRLTDIYWWRKYQAFLKEKEKEKELVEKKTKKAIVTLEKQRLQVKEYFQSNEFVNFRVIRNVIDKIIASNIMMNNSTEELDIKIQFLRDHFHLTAKKSLTRLICLAPNLFNESIETLEKRRDYFQVQLGCSDEEIQFFYGTKLSIGMQSMETLEFLHLFLKQEYNFETKDIKDLFLRPGFNPARLPEIIKDIVERKHYLHQLFTTQERLVRSLLMNPSLFWITPQELKERVALFAETIQANSLKDLIPLFRTSALVLELDKVKLNTEQVLSLFTHNMNLSADKKSSRAIKQIGLDRLTVKDKKQLMKEFRNKYTNYSNLLHSKTKRKTNTEEKMEEIEDLNDFESLNPTETLKRFREIEKFKWNQVMEAFSIEKSQNNETLNQSSIGDLANPYHQILGELVENIMKDHFENNLLIYENKPFTQDVLILSAKVIENIHFSFHEARDLCIHGDLLCHSVSSILPKLITLSATLHLSHDELMSIIERSPRILKENPLPKLIFLEQVVEDYRKETGEVDEIQNWLKSIEKAKKVTKAKEIYRNHPTITIVRELILRSVETLRKSVPRLKIAVDHWKKLPIEKRKQENLLDSLLPFIYKSIKD